MPTKVVADIFLKFFHIALIDIIFSVNFFLINNIETQILLAYLNLFYSANFTILISYDDSLLKRIIKDLKTRIIHQNLPSPHKNSLFYPKTHFIFSESNNKLK